MTASLNVRGVGHAFAELTALDRLDLTVPAGEILAVVGPSGCGKSTLLELIAGLRDPDRGEIEVGGLSDAAGRLERCAYMPQTDCLLPWYSAIDNAGLALRNRGLTRSAARARAAEPFAEFGLAGFEEAHPAELSGGMRQRVAFLRTLLSEKDVLLLDEPFAALDAITRGELQAWTREVMAADRRTVVLVTHDVEEALYLGSRVAVMSGRPGRVVELVDSPERTGGDRAAAVTAPEFTALRQRILTLLTGPDPVPAAPGAA